MIKSVNAILIASENPKILIEFYRKLGIALKEENHGGGIHAEADLGSVHFAIWSGGGAKVRKNNVSFSFHVPELDKFCKDLHDKGIIIDEDPHNLPFGGRIASLRDPDGNRIILMKWNSD